MSPAFSAGSYDAGDFSPERLALCDQAIRRPDLRTGSCNDQMGPETRWQFKDDFTWSPRDSAATTRSRFGVDVNYIEFKADILNNYSGTFTFDTNAPFDPNDPDTHPIQYTQSNPRFDDVPVYHYSAYVQDDWSSDRLTLNPRPPLRPPGRHLQRGHPGHPVPPGRPVARRRRLAGRYGQLGTPHRVRL